MQYIPNPPSQLAMNNFRAYTNKGLTKACRFVVHIKGGNLIPAALGNQTATVFLDGLSYLCESAELPGRAFMNIDARYYGPNQKLPFQSVYQDFNATFICRSESLEREFFDDWMTIINPINTWDFNYRNDYSALIDVFQFKENNEPNYLFTLLDAYPIIVNPQPVSWESNEFQKLMVTFTYTHWRRPNDPVAGAFSII